LGGFIKDYRRELDSKVWAMPPLYHRVWQWIKYSVNYMPVEVPFHDGRIVLVKKGEKITSQRQIAKGVGYYERGIWREPNPKTIKEILVWLEKEKMIEVESNSGYTHLKVLNWGIYQGTKGDESNSQETVDKQSLDTNKKEKKYKKYSDQVFNLLNYWNEKGIVAHKETDNMLKEIQKGLKKNSFDEIKKAIDRYVTLYRDSNYYYKHKWTLPKFLNQSNGVPNFLDEGIIWLNYQGDKKSKSNEHGRKLDFYIPEEE